MKRRMAAEKFKARCLQIMETVRATGCELIITKRNVPIAKLCAFGMKETSLFGRMRGTAHQKGDLLKPIDEVWNGSR